MNRFLVMVALVALLFAGVSFAQDKPQEKNTEEQFHAVALARSKAEFALRRLRTYYEQTQGRFEQVRLAPDASLLRIGETITKATQDEQRKPEDARNMAVIEEFAQRRGLINQDWARYANTERPAIDNAFRLPLQQMATLWVVWGNLANNEGYWKDMRLDLPTLQAAYDAVAKRADEFRVSSEKALVDAENWKKIWEVAAESADRPVMPK